MIKEEALYMPIKDYFSHQGFEVYGEVKDIDMVLKQEGKVYAIELKINFNLKLVLQAVERQKYMDSVYVAIKKPKYNKRYKEMVHLLKRLEIGLITVDFLKTKTNVVIEHHPLPLAKRTLTRKKTLVIKEVTKRLGIEDNIGGTTKSKRLTAYREEALLTAYVMATHDVKQPKDIKKLSGLDKTGQILYNNYYKWFSRVDKGIYELRPEAYKALQTYKKTVECFKEILEKQGAKESS